MGIPFFVKFSFCRTDINRRFYCCGGCSHDVGGSGKPPLDWEAMTHIALDSDLALKDAEGFNEKPAYLFRSIVNVTIEEPEFKMVGGQQYSAADVHCNRCLRPLGWKIVKVMYPPSQDFKEGRFLLDKAKIDDWDEVELDPPPGSSGEESMSTPVAATSEERESVAEACE